MSTIRTDASHAGGDGGRQSEFRSGRARPATAGAGPVIRSSLQAGSASRVARWMRIAGVTVLGLAAARAGADGRIVYSGGSASNTPQARAYSGSGNTFGAAAATVAGAASSAFYVERASKARNEHIAGYVTTSGVLYVLRWNGTAWSAEWSATVGGDGVNGRRFDIAYEDVTGDAVVAYSANASGNDELRYRTWNGTAWSAATNLNSANLTGVPTWIKLLSRPGSDEIALTVADGGSTTANSATLTTLIWNGTAWGNEPPAAHATNVYSTGSTAPAQTIQNDSFDMAYETVSGTLWVFWTQATPQQYRRSYGAGTWATATSFATARTAPLQMVAASDPSGDNVMVAFNRSGNAAVYAAVGNSTGGFTVTAVTPATPNGATTAINKKTVVARWLVSGGTSYPVVVWGTTTIGTVGQNRATMSGTTPTWGTAGTSALSGATSWGWMTADVDPSAADTLMLTYSDGGNALWAKRLVFVGSTPSYTWTSADGGTALGATLTNATTQNFDFAYDRYVPPPNARIVYSGGSAGNTPQVRGYRTSANVFGAASGTVAGAASSAFYVDRASAKREEHIAGYVTTGGVLYVLRWNGSAWSAEWNATVGGDGVNGRRFDIAYENVTGRAVVVYSANASGTDELRYRTWNGSTWSAAINLDAANLTGVPVWIKLLSRPGSDEIALTVADGGTTTANTGDLTTLIWNGTAWGNEPSAAHSTSIYTTGSTAPAQTIQNDIFDMAYETTSGNLLVVFTQASTAGQFRRWFTGSPRAWDTSTSFGGTARAPPMQMFAASNPNGNDIVVGWNRSGTAGVYAYTWAGGAWSASTTVSTNTTPALPVVNQRAVTAQWLVSGGTSYPVVVWGTGTAGTIGRNRATVSGTTVTWGTAATDALSGATSWGWMDSDVDPNAPDTLMLTYSDGAGDLWAKRLVLVGSTPSYGWTNADGGSALTATLTNATTQNFDFAYDRFVYVRTTTVATGTDPIGLPAFVAPGSAAQMVDGFTVQTDNGSDSITAVQVTLAAGSSGGVGLIEIVDDTGVTPNVFGSAAPAGDVTNITLGTPIAATTTSTPYRIRITPSTATAMPAPPGSVLNVTARITAVAVSYSASVADGTSATLVVDNRSSPDVTPGSVTPGNGSVRVDWTNPAAGTAPADDFAGTVLVLGNDTVAVTGAPTEGVTSYGIGDPVGADTVVCFGAITSCQKSGLLSADAYYFEIFTVDGSGNWSAGVPASGTSNAVPVTTVATGTDPTVNASWVAPGTGPVVIDAFTVQKSTNPPTGDTITAIQVTFAPGTAQGIGLVEIVDASNVVRGSVSNPSDVALVSVSIASTTTATPYSIRVTPRAHADMPAPPGGAYSVTARVSDVTVTYAKSVTDTVGASATLHVDNQSALAVTGASASAAGDTVTATWTNPAAGTPPDDFASVVVVGSTAAVSGAPTEGRTTYVAGDAAGSGTVVCAGAAITSCPRSGVGAGQTYYMKIFTRDALGNWSPGVGVAATAPDVRTTVVALTAELVDCGHVLLQASYTGDVGNSNTVTFARQGANITGCVGLGGGSNPRACTDTGTLTGGATYQYSATFVDGDGINGTNPVLASVSVPSGCTVVPPGGTAGANIPVVSIVNPANGVVIGRATAGFRVQVRVFSRDGSALQGLALTTDGSNPSCTAIDPLFAPTSHAAGPNATIYEKTVTSVTATGTYLLRACAKNGAGEARSEAVTIRYNDARAGDGNLLVRDNSAQLCNDCHDVKTHSSESTTSRYGSWSTTCADCHQPHRTRNLSLVAEQINAPSVNGYIGPVNVQYRDRNTGDSGTAANVSFVTSDASGRRGPCQACHTRTMDPSYRVMAGGAFTINGGTVTASGSPAFQAADVAKYILGPDGKSYRITAYTSATQVSIDPVYAGATASNQTFRVGPARWRNSGNDDANHYAGAGTMKCSTCHSHSDGFGATSICINCHGRTTARGGDFHELGASFWNDSVMARIDTDEWTHSGHGRTLGSYDVTGNPAANFPTSPSPGITECIYCHDDAVGHRDGNNPFRLRGASYDSGGGVIRTNAYSSATANAACLNCHADSSLGVDGGGGLKNGTVKANTAHDGAKHAASTLGGRFCWDCHDPHGDRTATNGGNIAMIRAQVFAATDGTHGYPGDPANLRTVHYTDRTGGSPGAGKSVEASNTPRQGICQACHGLGSETYWTKYWNRNGQDDPDGPGAIAAIASAHQSSSAAAPYCVSCHKHRKKFRGTGDCTGCHNSDQNGGAVARRNVTIEFTTGPYSHKRNGAYTVTKWDCIVCHMEGDATDTVDGDPSDSHGNGQIDLRDPDKGTAIESVTWDNGTPGSYLGSGTPLTAVADFTKFRRDLSSNVLEEPVKAVMINQCLKCHDGGGAAAFAPGQPLAALGTARGFTSGKPFGTTIAAAQGTYTGGSGYTACATGTDGCVTNIAASFSTANSSYHPILGKQNNSYAQGTRMAAPWNMTKTNGRTDQWGYLLSCWDCHALSTDTIVTATVTAHGGSATLRGTNFVTGTPSTTNRVTLCTVCHAGYYDTCTATNHCSGSAFATGGSSSMATYTRYSCPHCHGSGNPTAVVRPVRAEDAHGTNLLPAAGTKSGRWLTDPRPYAFLRNTTYFANHQPANIGGTAYTPTCTQATTGTSPCNNSFGTYTVGGTY